MKSNSESDSLLQIDEESNATTKNGTWCQCSKQKFVRRRRIIIACFSVACLAYAFLVYLNDHDTRDYGDPDTDALRFEPHDQDLSRKYRATQFISYTINTMGGVAEYGECMHRHVDKELGTCYLGDYNITNDVHQRVEILKRVLKSLKQDTNGTRIDDDPSTLKIMMVPEVRF
jgi:hypothetical protein